MQQRLLLLLPPLVLGQQCIGMHNVRYWPYPITDERVTYAHGFDPDDPSGCCDLCCESKTWPQIWNLYGNGTCRCLHDDYNDGWDGPKQYGTGDWSGACAFRRSAATPAGLDSKKFKTTNDTRIVAVHKARAHYTCSYPNDATTVVKIERQAVDSSKAAANGTFKWACGQCGAEVYDATYRMRETARFCAAVLDGSNKTSLAFAEQSYIPKAEGGAYCQELNGNFALDTVLIGIEQGKFEFLVDSHGFPSVQQCSPSEPPIKCVPHQVGHYPCHCDAACTNSCCKMEPAAEEMAVSFSWYSLEGSDPDGAMA